MFIVGHAIGSTDLLMFITGHQKPTEPTGLLKQQHYQADKTQVRPTKLDQELEMAGKT